MNVGTKHDTLVMFDETIRNAAMTVCAFPDTFVERDFRNQFVDCDCRRVKAIQNLDAV